MTVGSMLPPVPPEPPLPVMPPIPPDPELALVVVALDVGWAASSDEHAANDVARTSGAESSVRANKGARMKAP